MSRFTELLKGLAGALIRPSRPSTPSDRPSAQRGRAGRPSARSAQPGGAPTNPLPAPVPAGPDQQTWPGQAGPGATVEVDPASVGPVRMTYSPITDGDPDPGEIVWTWVPFEEHDGRGKDRPVLVVAAEPSGSVLAVQLTSKDHSGEPDFVPIGSGSWDGDHRASWVNIDRIIRVSADGMRREAASLDGQRYASVEAALRARYRWT